MQNVISGISTQIFDILTKNSGYFEQTVQNVDKNFGDFYQEFRYIFQIGRVFDQNVDI